MYDYDFEEYYEPTQADLIIEEYKYKMEEILKAEIKLKYDAIIEENNAIKEENKKLRNQVNEIRARELELEHRKQNIEREVRRERLSSLMKDFEVVMYRVDSYHEFLPKCDKCNDSRQIEFLSPSGKKMSENCECNKGILKYKPIEYYLSEFKINEWSDGQKQKPMLMWYKEKREKDYDYYTHSSSTSIDKVYSEEMKFEDIGKHDTYFKNIEDCQKYCDWLNENLEG